MFVVVPTTMDALLAKAIATARRNHINLVDPAREPSPERASVAVLWATRRAPESSRLQVGIRLCRVPRELTAARARWLAAAS